MGLLSSLNDAAAGAVDALVIPMHTVSEANRRDHWRIKAKRVTAQRYSVAWAWAAARWPCGKPRVVTLTRLAPRELDDDNLTGSFKAVRDQVAEECGFNDREKSVMWVYRQEKSKTYAVRIEVQR